MEFLRFIFSSVWVWLGFLVLLYCAGEAIGMVLGELADLVRSFKRGRKIVGHRVGDRWDLSIENASEKDATNTILAAHVGMDPLEVLKDDEKEEKEA